jgi:hypothetical protein
MDERNPRSKATFDGISSTTGRDGAMDFAVKSSAVQSSEIANANQSAERFARILGAAVIELWGDLPVPLQEHLFKRAVVLGHQSESDEMLREQLAKFLHDHHKCTVDRK